MRHTLCFRAGDDGIVLLEVHTIAHGLTWGHQRCAAELGVLPGRRIRVELLDHDGHLLHWRTYLVSVTGGPFPSPPPPAGSTPRDAESAGTWHR